MVRNLSTFDICLRYGGSQLLVLGLEIRLIKSLDVFLELCDHNAPVYTSKFLSFQVKEHVLLFTIYWLLLRSDISGWALTFHIF